MKNAILEKGQLHPRNKHQGRYDFFALIKVCPELSDKVITSPRGEASINFSDAASVMILNKALLIYFYKVDFWQIPPGYLCPPIPGRVDYIHYIADLVAGCFDSVEPVTGSQIKGLDIGCGASCIYPILGARSYDWSFVAVDIDDLAVKTASLLVNANTNVRKKVSVRQQKERNKIFSGVVTEKDRFAFSMCNPPFHASMEKATAGSLLKQHNLSKKSTTKHVNNPDNVILNFAGQEHELSYAGGEIAFVKLMAEESLLIKQQVCWFTCLLSKSANVAPLKKLLKSQNVQQLKVVEMSQGHKISRFIAWSYLNKQQQKDFFV